MQNYTTHGFAISRKILCLLLACILIIQTGCQTTKVLQSLKQEDLKAKDQHPLNLQKGQLVRITYMDSLNQKTKRLIGQVQSLTSDAIVVAPHIPGFRDMDKDVSISFKYIKKIELIEKKITTVGYVAMIGGATCLVISISIIVILSSIIPPS